MVAAPLLLLPLSSPAASCRVGERVLLSSVSRDPNVFVWDARVRLIAYAAGRYRSLADVVRHAALVKPGTHAIVVACVPEAVKLRYVDEPLDAIGLKVTSGPYRNRWGWVNSGDVHPQAAAFLRPRY